MTKSDLLARLRPDNVRLIALLEANGIERRVSDEAAGAAPLSLNLDIDAGHPALLRMWNKRQGGGYKAMGYRILDRSSPWSCWCTTG